MAIKIRTAGTTRKTTSKPAAKRTAPAKRSSPAKAKATTTRTAAKAKPSTRAKAQTAAKRAPNRLKLDPKVLARHEKALKAAGGKLAKAQQDHADATEMIHEAYNEARAAEVPMSIISELLGVSRQWLYKMGEHAGRNGNGKAKKSTAKRAVKSAAKAQPAKASTRKTTARKAPAKKATGRKTIRSR